MSFTDAIASCFRQYVGFSGRAMRSEFWWFTLFSVLVSIVASVVDPTGVIYLIAALGLFLPSLAVSARRLHDTDRSGWWLLIAFVPIIGIILLIVWWATAGTPVPNRHGPPLQGNTPGQHFQHQQPVIGVADELTKLGALRDSGTITAAEYDTQRSRLLPPAPQAANQAPPGSHCGRCGKLLSPVWRDKCNHCKARYSDFPPVMPGGTSG